MQVEEVEVEQLGKEDIAAAVVALVADHCNGFRCLGDLVLSEPGMKSLQYMYMSICTCMYIHIHAAQTVYTYTCVYIYI